MFNKCWRHSSHFRDSLPMPGQVYETKKVSHYMDWLLDNSYGMICHKTNILAIMIKKSLPSQCDSKFLDNVIKRPPTEEYTILVPPSSIKVIKLKNGICEGSPSCNCDSFCNWWKRKNIVRVEKSLCAMIAVGIKNFEDIDEFKHTSREDTYQCINCPKQIIVPYGPYSTRYDKLKAHTIHVHIHKSWQVEVNRNIQSLYYKIEEEDRCLWCEKKKFSGQKFKCRLV